MKIQRVRDGEEARFAGVVRVYEESLPAGERKSVAALGEMLARPEYMFLAGVEGDRVVGFAIAIALMGTDAALLEYMAVDAEHRGCGLGADLFRAVAAEREIAARWLLVEVESERENCRDQQLRERRKAFYRRLGARELAGVRYRMPQVASEAPPPMELLVYRREMPAWMEKDRVRGWLEACYAQVYGVPPMDRRIDTMLEGCGGCIGLV